MVTFEPSEWMKLKPEQAGMGVCHEWKKLMESGSPEKSLPQGWKNKAAAELCIVTILTTGLTHDLHNQVALAGPYHPRHTLL